MTPALADRTHVRPPARERRRPAACHPVTGGRLTLDELISSAWAGVAAQAPVACPWCGGRMSAEPGEAARCRSCASSLA